MRVIGIAGAAGAGKSTLMGFLVAALGGHGYMCRTDSFALPLKRDLRRLAASNTINKADPVQREFLQARGTKFRETDPGGFIHALNFRNGVVVDDVTCSVCQHRQQEFLLVDDVRYEDEAEFIQAHGILVFINGTHQRLPADLARHESESHLPRLAAMADYYIPYRNNLSSLAAAADTLVRDGCIFAKDAYHVDGIDSATTPNY